MSILAPNDLTVYEPLSAAQNSIFLAHALEPDSPQLNVAQYFSIPTAMEPNLAKQALDLAAREAETMRVRFVMQNGILHQIIDPPFQTVMTVLDLRSENTPLAAAAQWMKTDLNRTVDLLRGPLWKTALLQIRTDQWLWYFCGHHIINDGYGHELFTRRVAEIYSALAEGSAIPESSLGSLPAFLSEDRSYRASKQFERDRQYWLDRLRDRPEPVTLGSHVANQNSGGDWFLRRTVYLPASIRECFRRLKEQHGLDTPEIATAALATYLYRLRGAHDVVLGFPVPGRIGPIARKTPAMAANVVPLRLSLHAAMPVSELA